MHNLTTHSALASTLEKSNVKYMQMQKRIGSTTYRVNAHFCERAKETIQDKILRMVRNDLSLTSRNATMELPQTVWLLERSSS